MSGRERFDDGTLGRLIGAGRAPRDPATLTRAMARVRAAARDETRDPAWLTWLARPMTVAAAASLLVVSVVAGVWYGGGDTVRRVVAGTSVATTGTSSDLIGSLLTDETSTSTSGGTLDSGTVR